MDRGLFAAASGGLLNARRIRIVANNLANVNTAGYKAQRLVSRQQTFDDTLASQMSSQLPKAKADLERTPGVVSLATVTDFTPGPIKNTGNPLNVALRENDHFFVVQTEEGEAYTRAGTFTLDVDGNLVTQDGLQVMGDGGPISIPPGKASISQNGSVLSDNEIVGRIRTVQVDDLQALERTGGTRFVIKGDARATQVEADVVTSSLEMPNLSIMQAMVEMIDAQRSFEAYTKTAQSINDMNEQAIRNAKSN